LIEGCDVCRGKLLQLQPTESRLDVYPDGYLVAVEGALPDGASHGSVELLIEIFTDRKTTIVEYEAILPIGKRLS
jgi:hypothetical protein